MKKLVLPLNIIFLGLSLACDTALIITHLYPIKITASVFFMLAAAVNLIYALKYFPDKKLPSVILTVGVFFAMSADIAINLNFIAGAAIFALGHICYFIAYSLMQKPHPTDFIPAIIIFVPIVLFMMFSPLLDFGSVMMKIIGISYAVIICIMTGKAIMNFIRIKNRFNIILALGIVLYIRPAANGNLIGIATDRCIVPDARVFSNCDISFDNCTLCHIVSHGLSS